MTAVSQLFQNEALLKDTQLLLYLSSEDLVRLRLVCSIWRGLCTEILIQRQSLQLTFQGYGGCHSYQKYCRHPNSTWSLTGLTQCLKKCVKFPCVHFTFYGGDLGGRDILNFFQIFGAHIKSLNFDLKALLDPSVYLKEDGPKKENNKLQILRKILTSQAPNVESILIYSCHDNGPHPFPPSRPLPLHYRPCLNVGDEDGWIFNKIIYHSILREVMESAANLKNFPLTSIHLFRDKEIMEILMSRGACAGLVTIEKLCVDTNDINTNFDEPFFQRLTTFKVLPIKKIDIAMHSYGSEGHGSSGDMMARHCQVISSILKKIRWSTTQVKIHSFPRYIDGLDWPRLERVTKLCFYLGNAQDDKNLFGTRPVPPSIITKPFKWSQTFPALKTVEIDSSSSYSWDSVWENNFLGCHDSAPHGGVKKLRIGHVGPGVCLDRWLEKFGEIFPNLNDLELTTGNLPSVSQVLWQFKKLRKLDLSLPIGNRFVNNKFVNIDAAFTGFSENFCAKLALTDGGQNKEIFHSENIEGYRVRSSILNLRELKLLQLYFCGCIVPSVRIMSLYAFKLIPDLRVKISYCGI